MSKGRKVGETYKTHLWPSEHRECIACKNVLPFSMFHKHSKCWGGVNTVCKECRKEVSKQQWVLLDVVKKMHTRCKSRAVLKGIEFDIELSDLVVPEVCPVLGVPFDTSNDYCPSVDRIDSTKGYIKGNVMVMSNKANRMKSNATPSELQKFAVWINSGVCEI